MNESKWLLKGFNVSDIVQFKDKSFFISTLNKGLLIIPHEEMLQMTEFQSNVSTIFSSQSKVIYGLQSGDVSVQDTLQKSIQHIQLKGSKEVSFVFHDTLTQTIMVSGIHSNFIHQNQTNQENFIIKDACYYKNGVLLATNIGLLLFTSKNIHSLDSIFTIKKSCSHAKLFSSIVGEPIQKVVFYPKEDLIYYFSANGLFQLTNTFAKTKLPELKNNIVNIEIFDEKLLIFTKNNNILTWNGKNYIPIYGDKIEKSTFLQVKIIQGTLWILTENGLIEFDGKTAKKRQFYHHFDFNDFQSFAIFDKYILINTYDKVLQFPINQSEEKLTANLIIHENSTKKSNHLPNHTALHYTNNSIVFKFSILSFHHNQAIHLAYKINDEPLIHLNAQNRELHLNHLIPDDYEIKFFLIEDNQPKFVSEFHFTIKPPFHKTIWFYFLLVFLTSVVIFYLSKKTFERWKRTSILEQTKLMLEKELDKSLLSSIRAQMNPHFLFNALNTIQSYIYMNDKKSASIYISKFSDLTRTILNVSGKEFVSIEEEVELLNLYLDLEKMRFEDEFEFKISLSFDIHAQRNTVKIPPMMIQPYVENAIKHGLLHKKDNRKLSIDFIIEHQKLVIIIEDNGVGRQRSSEINQIKQKKYPSFAIEANKKRLEILQNYYQNISFEIIDLYEGEKAVGTKVVIMLPIEYNI